MFFILGAGASRDSGLPTYRGAGGIYNNIEDVSTKLNVCNVYREDKLLELWSFLHPLYEQIKVNKPGRTYELIAKLAALHPYSAILTQNIDGYCHSVGVPFIEIHGTYKTMTCMKCYTRLPSDSGNPYCDFCCDSEFAYDCSKEICRPDIILFGEDLNKKDVRRAYLQVKHNKYIVVIGTTLEFPYLRTFISKGKMKGAKVIHINPDPEYGSKIRNGEIWIQKTAADGLEDLLSGKYLVT